MRIDRALQLALSEHNAGVRRARREYATHPTAGPCIQPGCDELALLPAGFCHDDAVRAALCVECQVQPPARPTHTRCWACEKRATRSATERMRLRRARQKAAR